MIRLALGLYRLLLRFLPGDLRAVHADAMVEMVAESLEEARSRGRLAQGRVMAAAVADLFRRGPYEHWLERERNHRRQRRMGSLPQDIRYVVRGFGRQPGVTAILLLTLSLGIAAAIAVFSLVNGVLIRPLPFREPDRLVFINETAPKWNLEYTEINYPDFVRWREAAARFESMALHVGDAAAFADDRGADRVEGARVTWDFARVLGITPLAGRGFTEEEDRPGGPAVVMLGEALWRNRFGADPAIVGRTVRIDSRPHTVVGILPRAAEFPSGYKYWRLLQQPPVVDYQSYSYSGIGRLKRGVTLAEAKADLDQAHQPIWAAQDTARTVSPVVESLRDRLVRDFELMTVALGVGVVLVLVCACTNVAGTMLARAIFRQREMALRMALGADAGRVGGLLIVESVVLAAVAGVIGAAVAQVGLRAFLGWLPDQLPPWMEFTPDWRVILAAVVGVGLTAVLFGTAPALQARHQDARAVLSGSGRSSLSLGQRRWLDGFVIAEVALATILLIGGGLLLRAYQAVTRIDPGFRVENVARFRVALPQSRYPDSTARVAFMERLERGMAALPGVERAGVINCPPLSCHFGNFFNAEAEAPRPPGAGSPVILTLGATPGYFETLGIPLTGETFAAGDGQPGSRRAVIVSEEFARTKWPDGSSPIGRRVWFNGADSTGWMTVIGVAANVRHYGLDRKVRPTVYLPMRMMVATWGVSTLSGVLHTRGSAEGQLEAIRRLVRDLDPELAVFDAGTMSRAIERSLAIRRVLSAVLALFAGLALILAVGGIYAVVSYVVGRRTVELGIRVALGAERRQVVGLVLRQGARLVVGGLLIGLPLAMVGARMLASKVEGLHAFDPLAITAAVGLLAAAGLGAAFVPARRASSVDPRVSLFSE